MKLPITLIALLVAVGIGAVIYGNTLIALINFTGAAVIGWVSLPRGDE